MSCYTTPDEWQELERLREAGDTAGVARLSDKIARDNMGLVHSIVKRFHGGEEHLSAAMLAMDATIRRYNWRRGTQFSTYYCRAAVLAISRVKNPLPQAPDERDSLRVTPGPNRPWHDAESNAMGDFRRCVLLLPPELRRIIELRCQGQTLQQIGDIIGLSKERVRQLRNKATDMIRANMQEMGWHVGTDYEVNR